MRVHGQAITRKTEARTLCLGRSGLRSANERKYVNECPNLDVNDSVLAIIITLMRHKGAVEEWERRCVCNDE